MFPSANELVKARYNKDYDSYGEHQAINHKNNVENALNEKLDHSLLSPVGFREALLSLCDSLLTSTEQAFKVDIEKFGFPIQNLLAATPNEKSDLASYQSIVEIVGEEVMKIESVNKFVDFVLNNHDAIVTKFKSWGEWIELRKTIPTHLILEYLSHMIKVYSPLVAIDYIIAAIVIILLNEGYPNAFDIYSHNCYIWSRTVKNIATQCRSEEIDDRSISYYANHAKVSPVFEFMQWLKNEI